MAALLSSEIEDGNKRDIMVEHIDDARRLGVDVLPPNVNASEPDFSVQDGKIVFGLAAIKGVGRGSAEEVARARAAGSPYRDLFDFCERVDHKVVNRAAMERLVKAGAFDCLGAHRAQLLHVLPRALQAASERQNDRRVGQLSLFETVGGDAPAATALAADDLPAVPAWPETEKLKYEKEVLDFYFSSHPLAQMEKDLRRYATYTTEQVKGLAADQPVTLAGMLSGVRFKHTKKARNGNSRFAAFKLEDFAGSAECVVWPDDLLRCKDVVVEDAVCIVQGTVKRDREEPLLVLNRILTLEQARREMATGLYLLLKLGVHSPLDIDALARVLRQTPGNCPVYLTVRDPAGRKSVLKLGRDFGINPATYAKHELEAILGPDSVRLT
jgi:DNA polymerase-3 subunit alpha